MIKEIQSIRDIKLDLESKNYDLTDFEIMKLAIDIQRNQILEYGLTFQKYGKNERASTLFDIACEIEKISTEINNK